MKNLSLQMHRTPGAVMMLFLAALYIIFTIGFDDYLPGQGEQGLCLPSPALWPLPEWADVCGGILLNVLVVVLMSAINKAYNVLRSTTRLQTGLYAVMLAAVPRLVVNVNSGVLLALSISVCVLILFGCYSDTSGVRNVFLSFLLLSTGSTIQYCFVVYIPVMWIVLAQMKIFNPRTFLASVFGILTPWIILLGFGIVTPEEVHLPQVKDIFSSFDEESVIYQMSVTGFTAFLLLLAIALNVTKTIAYNARARAFNGALTIIAVVTIIAISFNYNNLLAYLPLLCVCSAYQLTHWFVNHRFERQYIAVLSVIAVYIVFYVWRLLV